MRFEKHPYQVSVVPWLLNTPRGALWADMGSGKTPMAAEAISILLTLGDVTRVLVIAPKKVSRMTWPQEVATWDHLKHLVPLIEPIVGDHEARIRAVRSGKPVHLINWDLMPWLLEHFGPDWPYDMVVEDESTRCRAHDAVIFRGEPKRKEVFLKEESLARRCQELDAKHRRYRVGRGRDGRAFIETAPRHGLMHVARKTARWLLLSGTPMPKGYTNLWAQIYRLDGGARLGASYSDFLDRYFTPGWVSRDDPRKKGNWQIKPGAADVIMSRIKDVCMTVTPDVRLQPCLIEHRSFLLPPGLRDQYNELKRELFLQIQGVPINAMNAAVLTGKLRQFVSGVMYSDEGDVSVHDLRMAAFKEVVEELDGHPILVAYHLQSELARLQAAFPEARVLDHNPRTAADWNEGRIPMLLAHPQSCGHGLNLQRGGHHLVFFSLDWSLEYYQQIMERIGPMRQYQAGLDRPTYVYLIMAKKTIDDAILQTLEGHATTQDAFKQYMRQVD